MKISTTANTRLGELRGYTVAVTYKVETPLEAEGLATALEFKAEVSGSLSETRALNKLRREIQKVTGRLISAELELDRRMTKVAEEEGSFEAFSAHSKDHILKSESGRLLSWKYDPEKTKSRLTHLSDLAARSDEVPDLLEKVKIDCRRPVLMSAGNLSGWKLEELCLQLIGEIEQKDAKLADISDEVLSVDAKLMYSATNRANIEALRKIAELQAAAINFREGSKQ